MLTFALVLASTASVDRTADLAVAAAFAADLNASALSKARERLAPTTVFEEFYSPKPVGITEAADFVRDCRLVRLQTTG